MGAGGRQDQEEGIHKLIHSTVQQKPAHCKAITLQLRKNIYTYVHMRICIYGASQVAGVEKNLLINARDIGDVGLILGSGRALGGEHGNPLQYSCLENPMDRGAWWATVHGVAKSQT